MNDLVSSTNITAAMRKILPVLLCMMIGSFAHAQSDSAFATVKYKLTHISDTTWPENPAVTNYILYLGKNLSNYTNFDREEGLRKSMGGNLGVITTISGGNVVSSGGSRTPVQTELASSIGNIYKKLSDSKLVTIEYPYGQLFAIEDKMPEINWSIQPDTKEILGLQCQKAVADFRGRTYEAWFTSQLPYSNGPWKLGGLPGLIIEAADTKREVIFSFVSFENLEEKKAIGITALASKTTPKEFKQFKEATEKDNKAMVGSATASGRIMVTGSLAAGPDGKIPRFRAMNNPIEKEIKK
jgi:GLPGLI family protein